MKCPYYLGIEKSGKNSGIQCTKGFLLLMSDEKIHQNLDTCCVGDAERDHCRPFLFRRCEELGLNPQSDMDTETTLRNMYLEKIYVSGTVPPKEEKSDSDDENTVLQSAAKKTEEKTMPEELENATATVTEVSTRRQYAEKLHNEIIYNAEMVCNYLVELCKNLKRMRDETLYTELGYDTFDDYVEKDVGIKKRQAYTYISTYERLGDTFLQSNAKLGITKLAMLTEVPAADRPDFADDKDLANMSTREVKELVEKSKQQGEQLSLLTGELDEAKTRASDAAQGADKARKAQNNADRARLETDRQLKEAQARIAKLQKAEPDAATLEKLKKDAEKAANKGLKDKIKAETDKAVAAAKADADAKIKAAREEGEKAAEERVKESLVKAENAKEEALKAAETYKKELDLAKDDDSRNFAEYFKKVQETFNMLCGLIMKIKSKDSEKAEKMRNAMKAMVENQANEVDKI